MQHRDIRANTSEALPGRAASIGIMVGITAVYFFSYMQTVAVPGSIFDELQTAFKAPASAITALSVIFFYIYGGMQPVVGALADRVGVFIVLLTGGIALCVGSFVFPMAHTVPVLYVGRALVAVGASLVYATVIKSLDALFSARLFPIVLGLSFSIGNAGGLVGTLPFAVLSDRFGWRAVLFLVGGLTLLAFTIIVPLVMRVRILTRGNKRGQGLSSIRTILSNRCSLPVIVVVSINVSVYFLFQGTLGKKLLLDLYHVRSATAALFPCIMMLVSASCLLSSGMVSRALGHRRKPVILFASCVMVAGGALLACCALYGLNYIWVLVSYCLLGFAGMGSVMSFTLMKEHNPPEAMGAAICLTNGFSYLTMAVYTGVAGWILDRFAGSTIIMRGAVIYPREAYLTIICLGMVMLVLAFCLACFLTETRGIQSGLTAQVTKFPASSRTRSIS